MPVKSLMSSVAAVLAVTMFAAAADAGERPKFRGRMADDHYYAGPQFLQRVPGMRLVFGDYALSQEEFDALYGDRPAFDESYYEPEAVPVKPQKKPVKAASPAPPGQAATAAAPARQVPLAEKSAPTAPRKSVAAAIDCGKAGTIISGYGFSSVKPQSCSGKLYAFNASRGGRNFAITLDPASGELTEVKKLN